MAYLARDGLYLRGVPGTTQVAFSAPGGSPDRIQVEFNQRVLHQGERYTLIATVTNGKYHLDSMSVIPRVDVDDTYNFQSFPGTLISRYGQTDHQFMLEPTGVQASSQRHGCILL